MNSIPEKQAPHKSPWVWIGARQEIQMGGSNRSATERSAVRQNGARAISVLSVKSVLPINMASMISRLDMAGEA